MLRVTIIKGRMGKVAPFRLNIFTVTVSVPFPRYESQRLEMDPPDPHRSRIGYTVVSYVDSSE